jgi:RimJ/RimL family protein N-acetyltransferase
MTNATILETERLSLRPVCEQDLGYLCSLYGNAEVMRYLDKGVLNEADCRDKLTQYMQFWQDNGFGRWLAFAKDTGEFAGRAGFGRLSDTKEVHLGFVLLPQFWGKGLATEIARFCLDFGFNTIREEHLLSAARATNKASRAVIEKIGMHKQREAEFFGHTAVIYTLSAKEYFEKQAR